MSQDQPDLTYRDKVDIRFIFNQQLSRCLQSVGTPYFPETVEALARLLPTASYYNLMDRDDEWKTQYDDFIYKEWSGSKLGTPENPICYDRSGLDARRVPVKRLEDGSVDWTDPNIHSPKMVRFEEDDHMLMLRFVLEEAQTVGLLWSSEGGGVVNTPVKVLDLLKADKSKPRIPTLEGS